MPHHSGMKETTNTKYVEIFRPGSHTTAAGQKLNFTEADLAATAKAYDPALHEAPVVIGHPQQDAPAYGWVQSVNVTPTGGLDAAVGQIDPQFAEAVRGGRYKKISASFYAPDSPNNPVPGVYYLRHVGFLGAQPPAVKGLRQVAFASHEDGVVDVDLPASQPSASESLYRRLTSAIKSICFGEMINSRLGIDDADDQPIPSPARAVPAPTTLSFDTRNAGAAQSVQQPIPEEDPVPDPDLAALRAENEALKAKIKAAEDEMRRAEQAAKEAAAHKEATEFAESLVNGGQIKPADKAAMVAIIKCVAESDKRIEFADGGTTPLLTEAKRIFAALPKQIEFGEHATHNATTSYDDDDLSFGEASVDQERLALHRKAAQVAKANNISYEQAARRVMRSM